MVNLDASRTMATRSYFKMLAWKNSIHFLYEKAVKSKSGEGSILEYTYGKIGVMFKLQLNNIDPQMGTNCIFSFKERIQNISKAMEPSSFVPTLMGLVRVLARLLNWTDHY